MYICRRFFHLANYNKTDMSEDRFKNKYCIPSARAAWHDYNGGIYFVTICTHAREHYFGEIRYDENGEAIMTMSEIGKHAEECISKMELLHNDITVPLWVVMPNHIHLLVIVEPPPVETPYYDVSTTTDTDVSTTTYTDISTETNRDVSTPEKRPNTETPYYDVSTLPNKNQTMQAIANHCGRMSHIISRFKSAVTKSAHENGIPFAWQPRFYDHIVRDTAELNRIATYICK